MKILLTNLFINTLYYFNHQTHKVMMMDYPAGFGYPVDSTFSQDLTPGFHSIKKETQVGTKLFELNIKKWASAGIFCCSYLHK